MKNIPLYIIIFKDGTNYLGGNNYFNTGWNNMPNKPIKRIFYTLPTGDNICLEGYEKYFHMVEATKDWMRITKNKSGLVHLGLCPMNLLPVK